MLTARPQTSDPLTLCITAQKAADWLRADIGVETEADTVSELVRAAMARVETMCKQPIFARNFYGYGDGFCLQVDLPSLNVLSLPKIEYKQMGNATWTVLEPTQYDWRVSGELTFYPTAQLISNVSQIRVSYRAGYEPAAVPADILQAIRLLIGRWYDIRSDEKKEVPSHAEWLIKDYVLPIL